MKYIITLLIIILLVGCTPIITEPVVITETVTETIVVTETIEVVNTDKIDRLREELDSYKDLLNNLSELLGYVYLIECENDIGGIGNGTAFAIEYNQDIYIISAGHLVDNPNGIFNDFRIMVGNEWVELELLEYDNDYMNREDYAILMGEIYEGFKVDLDNDNPLYLIGDTITDYRRTTIEGESGSPVIDIDGEVTEIATTDNYGYNTDIDVVLEAINLNKKE